MAIMAQAACIAPSGAGDNASSQTRAYSQRSVEIVSLALRADNGELANMISPNASFAMGAGDVGMPLGTGVDGAKQLAQELAPASFEFSGWDHIPVWRDACAKQEVEVRFLNKDGSREAPVKFVYENGALVSASGWWRSRVSGDIETTGTTNG
jgi:hypothetical protein